jgi:hypothetical protein
MQNSYLIKNHGASGFDKYYNMMRRRRADVNVASPGGAGVSYLGGDQSPDKQRMPSPSKNIRGKKPAARDGHTGLMYRNHLMVFGGDRHHVPFNDTYMFDIGAELEAKELL